MTDEQNGDAEFLRQAVAEAVANVADGGGPFGALIVKDGVVIAVGQNCVTRDNDPSAHAEVTAIRRAAAALATFSLEGCVLYTSCEPCPMCAATALWARVDRIVFAADRDDAAAGGFDDSRFWEQIGQTYEKWDVPVQAIALDERAAPFDAWRAAGERVEY